MSESKTLPAIIKEATSIVQAIMEMDGELPPELELAQNLNAAALSATADRYGYVQAELDARAEFLKARIEAYKAALSSIEKASDSLSERVKWAMSALGVKEIAGDETRFVLMQNPPRAVVENEKMIPGSYFVSEVKTTLDKKMLLEDLKAGQEVPGAKMERGVRVARKINTSAKKVVGS
jgi:hypothetical protein